MMKNAVGQRTHQVKEVIELVVVIFTALISIYGFLLKDIIRPEKEAGVLNLNQKITKEELINNVRVLQLTIVSKNPSNKRLYVPAFWYTIEGSKITDTTNYKYQSQKDLLKSGSLAKPISTYDYNTVNEVAVQGIINGKYNYWWEPNEESTEDIVFTIPNKKYDYITINIFYLHTKYINDITDCLWGSNDIGQWTASFCLKSNIKMSVNDWQKETGSGLSKVSSSFILINQ
jgi:hypothetical protein